MTAAIALSLLAVVVSAAAAYGARHSRRLAVDLSDRYAEAIALVVLVARAEPPVASSELRAACERLLTKHHVEATVRREPLGQTVH